MEQDRQHAEWRIHTNTEQMLDGLLKEVRAIADLLARLADSELKGAPRHLQGLALAAYGPLGKLRAEVGEAEAPARFPFFKPPVGLAPVADQGGNFRRRLAALSEDACGKVD